MKGLFHLAIPAYDLISSRDFYTFFLNSKVGRENKSAIILDFFNHQIVLHKSVELPTKPSTIYPHHSGFIFETFQEWKSLLNSLKQKEAPFYQTEKCRHLNKSTEHHTFFLQDPSYNLLEFKFYKQHEAIFGFTKEFSIGDIK